MKIREVMSCSVHTCRPEDSLASAAAKLWEHDCGALPVLDGDGRVQAMITDRDICMGAFLGGRRLGELRVGDSMSKGVVSCRPEDEVRVARERMGKHQVHRLPVVDPQGKLVGILSLNDLAVVAEHEHRRKEGRVALDVLTKVSRHRTGLPSVAGPAHDVGVAAEQS